MQEGFVKKYARIYFWQAIAISVNLLSLFIVVPYISKTPSLYGIYTFCVSFNIFFAYADLGFVSAGYKYAAEAYARKDQQEETEITAFVTFILSILILLLMGALFIGVLYPEWLFSSANSSAEDLSYTSSLLLITILGAPNSILQRILQITFGIRLEDFLFQKINVFFNVLKILSVFIFFSNGKHNITGYYLTFQVLTYLSTFVGLYILTKRYNYNWKQFFHSFHFSGKIYKLTRSLAYSSLWVTLCWIIYYELDSMLIAKILGYQHLATYAIGLSLTAYCRTLAGIIYSPFAARFNHFTATEEIQALVQFFEKVVIVTLPFIFLPILGLILFMQPFVIAWAGSNYYSSIVVAQILVSCYLFAFLSSPANLLIMALKKTRLMYWINAIMAIVFMAGTFLTVHYWGIYSFAIFKLVAIGISAAFYFNFAQQFLGLGIWGTIKKIILPFLPAVLVATGLSLTLVHFITVTKSIQSFMLVVFLIGISAGAAILVNYYVNSSFRSSILYLKSKLL